MERRYCHFEWFHNRLLKGYSLLVWLNFSEKQITHKFDDEFLEKRRSNLRMYIRQVVKHIIAGYSGILF